MAKIKKAKLGTTTTETTKPMSAKDSMNMYANKYDSLSAEAAKKLGSGKNASKDIKGANQARAKEKAIAKRLYGTTPSNKKGGVVKAKSGKMLKKQAAVAIAMKKAGKAPKKAMMGNSMMVKPVMKSGGTLAPTKKSVGKTIGKLNKAKSGSKMSKKK